MIQRKPVKPNRKLEKVKFYKAFSCPSLVSLSWTGFILRVYFYPVPDPAKPWGSANLTRFRFHLCFLCNLLFLGKRGSQKGLLQLVLISLLPHWVGLWSLLGAPWVGPQAAPLGKKRFTNWRNQGKTNSPRKALLQKGSGAEYSSFSVLWGPNVGISEMGERQVKTMASHCGF